MAVARKQPLRTCAACKASADKRALIRFVRIPAVSDDGSTCVHLDPTGRKAGRGAYLCQSAVCFEKACKNKALEKALRCPIGADDYERLATEFVDWCSKSFTEGKTG